MSEVSTEENASSTNDLMAQAREAEDSSPEEAVRLYHDVLKKDPLHVRAYDRLMILYRKEKDYKKELSLINSGIRTFEKLYNNHPGKHSKKISEISNKLNKAFHLVDKKGNSLYAPEPVGRWQKRRAVVEKKLNKSKAG